ncbi:hypothetical protein BJY00DRAFT_319698 [Aspergillus carlsbadensis]|nr:hypothetical protein BJY00DRAFT_319698 [Aspergillus carlsbadensis]
MFGGRLWAGYNETCSKDMVTGEYCNSIIDRFTIVDLMEQMKEDEICSYCFLERHQLMQPSPYSPYDNYYKSVLEAINTRCGLPGPTKVKEIPLDPVPTEEALCLSDETYTPWAGDTCTSIAKAHSLSSAALYMGNQDIIQWCSSIKPGLDLCLPLSCAETYELQPSDTCSSIEYAFELGRGDVRKYNPWISTGCANMHLASEIYGTIICLSPQGGEHVNDHDGTGTTPSPSAGYADTTVPPPADANVAEGTTMHCGRWHEARDGESCVAICLQGSITHDLFVAVNPSLDLNDCAASLQVGRTYCTGPMRFWDTLDGIANDEVLTG